MERTPQALPLPRSTHVLRSVLEWSISTYGIGGGFTAATSASGDLSFTPTVSFDRIVVYTATNGSNGTSTINVDGGSSLGSILTSRTQALGVHTFTVSAGTHAINITPPTGGTIFILGIEVYTNASPVVRVYNAGKSATKVATVASASLAWEPYNWWATLQPDLTIVNYTINDSNQTGQRATATGTYTSQMTSVIQRAQTYGDCLLMIGNPTSTEASLQTYRDICYSLADTYNCGLTSRTGGRATR
jgi:hypothetical protein